MFGSRILTAIAALALPALPAHAASPEGETFGDWRVACNEAGPGGELASCQAYLSLVEEKTGMKALSVSFHVAQGAAQPTGVVVLPLGVALRPGVQMRVGKQSRLVRLEPEVCYPDGCRADFEVDPALQQEMTAAREFTVGFFAYTREDKPASIAVSTKGLAAAIARLKR